MKKILALIVACALLTSTSICAFASDAEQTGSKSPSAQELQKRIEELQKQIEEQTEAFEKQMEEQNAAFEKQMEEQNAAFEKQLKEQSKTISGQAEQIKNLTNTIKASGGSGSGGSSSSSSYNAALTRNNAVTYGSNTIAQGGHVEINGGKSNITFLIAVPDAGTSSSAVSLAANLGGTLLNVVTVASPVSFRSAKVNFYITGVNIGDNIAVYQVQGGKWVQLQTAEIRKDHVVVNMSQVGPVAFVRVPVLATAIN